MKDLIPKPRTFLYGQRRENVLHEFKFRTQAYKNSFFPNCVRIWNDLGIEFRGIESVNKFKKHIRNLIQPIRKSIFGIHNPTCIKRLFQLRLSLSPLNKHKFDHNFADTPSSICECGITPEDTLHFFFTCPLYYDQRVPLMEIIINSLAQKDILIQKPESLLHVCLYGHPKLNDVTNKNILNASLKYISETNRFP